MTKHTINMTFPDEVFVREEKDGDDRFFCTSVNAVDAVEGCADDEGFVATYRLVKVEKLKLVRTVDVVKVK
jgi:hypothetical protein